MRELSLNIMDIVQNSISAKANLIEIKIVESLDKEELSISIKDNGRGMSEEILKGVIDPFYTTRTTRSVGLGIPLFKMEAEMTGGSFEIDSKLGEGTSLTAIFKSSSVDMIPLGDINSVILPLVTGNPDIDFIYTRELEKNGEIKDFALNTKEVKEVLGGDVPLHSPDVVLWLKDMLKENTDELYN